MGYIRNARRSNKGVKRHMNIKDCNRQISKWQHIAHDVKQGSRESLIQAVIELGGDQHYMKECTVQQAMTQVKLMIEDFENERLSIQ